MTKAFLCCLLEKNPKKRLKINDVKKHQFFENVDFNKLIDYKYKAPFIPDIVR